MKRWAVPGLLVLAVAAASFWSMRSSQQATGSVVAGKNDPTHPVPWHVPTATAAPKGARG